MYMYKYITDLNKFSEFLKTLWAGLKCMTYLSQVVGGVISLPLQVVIKHVSEDIMILPLPQATTGPVLTVAYIKKVLHYKLSSRTTHTIEMISEATIFVES